MEEVKSPFRRITNKERMDIINNVDSNNNLKTVKVVDKKSNSQQQQRKVQPVVNNANTNAQKNSEQVSVKPKVQDTNKEYLILLMLDNQDTESNNTSFIHEYGRNNTFASILDYIENYSVTQFDIDFYYDSIDYEKSFAICEGVTLSQKITLVDFLEKCLKECDKNTLDKFMVGYVDAIVKAYRNGNFDIVDEYILNSTYSNRSQCTGQVDAVVNYTVGFEDGEDLM